MRTPLKPLLCRHDYFWSERHQADRCRRCGKLNADVVAADPVVIPAMVSAEPILAPRPPAPEMGPPAEDSFLDIPVFHDPLPPKRAAASDKVLKAQARLRRDALLGLLDRLAEGRQPSREEAIDAVLGVIEDAHSADPVLFGDAAANHFARLHEARAGLIF
ncbi:hypothetical protein [Brevundimonas sp.]|uniref:hypothetical protein n=1 Tax=Brevundimonas sp. TaxID=1871086 RepID=UPI003F718876